MIVMDEKIVGIWFIGFTGKDWMCSLRELEAESKYELVYRFRYHVDAEAFDSKDKKNWWKGNVTGTRAYCIAATRMAARDLSDLGNGTMYETLNDGDLQDFIKRFQNQPFVYLRMAGKDGSV